MGCPTGCTSTNIVTDERGPHIGEWCENGHFLRWVPKAELGLATRSTRSRQTIAPRDRARVLERFGHSCMSCGRLAGDVILHVDHIIPVELARG